MFLERKEQRTIEGYEFACPECGSYRWIYATMVIGRKQFIGVLPAIITSMSNFQIDWLT